MSDLINIDIVDAIAVFTHKDQLQKIIDRIKEEVDGFVPDLSTEKGRKEIASIARKVSSSKVAIDKAGKELVSGWKAQCKEVDNGRKFVRDELDSLRDKVREPLTMWENEQKAKEEAALREKEEAERLERERIEAEQRAKEEELRKKEAELEEKERAMREAEEKARIEKEAQENARREAEAAIERERLDAERRVREEKQRADLEILRAKEQSERLEREKKEAEERRKADVEHRRAVNNAAVSSIIDQLGCDRQLGINIIRAIASNKVANVTINY